MLLSLYNYFMSEKQKQKKTPADYDWRFRAVTSVAEDWINPNTGSKWEKGDILYALVEIGYNKGSLSFPVPDVTAMFLNTSYGHHEKARWHYNLIPIDKKKKRIKQSTNEDANIICFYESLFASIIFAYNALEAFANQDIQQTPDGTTFAIKDRKGNETRISKDDAESGASVYSKIRYILPQIYEIKLTTMSQAWRDFKELERFRNRLVHIKYKDTKSHLKIETDTIWNELFRDDFIQPHKLAYGILKKFIASSSKMKPPRWYDMYPKQML